MKPSTKPRIDIVEQTQGASSIESVAHVTPNSLLAVKRMRTKWHNAHIQKTNSAQMASTVASARRLGTESGVG